ncbi:MAG: thioredoxin domain-containing protein [Saprospiraceae bacterium]|nr:thioredoxin domain-containing protein [Saprospiraceae bacterium]
MNRLRHETSPYLLQHAHNPVDWYAWKPEAFDRARSENKPIIVSIGYSTCHWCHVMERESFEDEAVAAFMNEHFINIKVDREERPDVDQIYMEACQAITGGGGWPLNCFLTPDGRPFYAGTYYPPAPAHNRPSWIQVLHGMLNAFHNKRETVESQADRLTGMISGADEVFLKEVTIGEQVFSQVMLQNIYRHLQQRFDREEGGFGGAPKFPGTMTLEFLQAYHHYTGETEALAHVEFSLQKMIRGGIYDQIGGGFARYATDRAWLIPHFEKMLYDNALLVQLLSDVYKVSPQPIYRRAIEETLEFVAREMTHPQGAFFSALDADSEGVEGKFYVWSREEIAAVLGEEAELCCAFYGATEAGNWEHTNILWQPLAMETFAQEHDMALPELERRIAGWRNRLFDARKGRIRPGLDDKIILSWNAMQTSAYAAAYAALGEERYRQAAVDNLRFLLDQLKLPEAPALYHTWKDGQAQYDAFLDDYALFIAACIDVYQISFDTAWLDCAVQYAEYVLARFMDEEKKLFYFTSDMQQDVLMRKRDLYDSAVPSGNSTMALNLQRLGLMLDRNDFRQLAQGMLSAMREATERYPSSFARWAKAVLHEVHPPAEVAAVGGQAVEWAKELARQYSPGSVWMAAAEADERYPLLKGRGVQGKTLLYICRNYACLQPADTVEAAAKLLSDIRS